MNRSAPYRVKQSHLDLPVYNICINCPRDVSLYKPLKTSLIFHFFPFFFVRKQVGFCVARQNRACEFCCFWASLSGLSALIRMCGKYFSLIIMIIHKVRKVRGRLMSGLLSRKRMVCWVYWLQSESTLNVCVFLQIAYLYTHTHAFTYVFFGAVLMYRHGVAGR